MNRRRFLQVAGLASLAATTFNIPTYGQTNGGNFGWIPYDQRTTEQKRKYHEYNNSLPEFKIQGNGNWKELEKGKIHECIRAVNGKNLKTFVQNVGSCVGMGKARAEWNLQHVQKVMLGKREKPNMPYEPYGYAQSRVCAGISGFGDGSTGHGAAEAAQKYGVLTSLNPKVPTWKETEKNIVWPGGVDKEWGNRGAPSEFLPLGKEHLVKTVALIKNTDDALASLTNGYLITIASNWGGQERLTPQGSTYPILLNKREGNWNHMMEVSDFWFHPDFNRELLFYIENSWGWDFFYEKESPDGSPNGGFWVRAKELQSILDQRESYVYSNFDGFPEQFLDKALFDLIGD